MTTIIQCPNCQSRYRLKFEIADGQQVRCPNCQTIWRYQTESMLEPLEAQQEGLADREHAGAAAASQPSGPHFGSPSGHQSAADPHESAPSRHGSLGAPVLDESGGQDAAWNAAGAAQAASEPAHQEGWNDDAAGANLDAFWQRGQQADHGDGSDADQGYDPAIAAPRPSARQNAEFGSFSPGHAQNDAMGHEEGERQADASWASELAAVINRSGTLPEFRGSEGGAGDAQEDNSGISGMRPEPAAAMEATGADFWRDSPVSRALGDGGEDTFGEIGPDGDWQPMSFDTGREDSSQQGGGLALAAAWGVYFTVAGGLLLAAFLMRDAVVQAMPGASTLYARVGLVPPANALSFDGVTYAWVTREGRSVLEVRGMVVNQTSSHIVVPPLRISVRDNQNMEIAKTKAAVVKDQLGPHGKSSFTLEFLSAPQSVSEIELQLQR